MNQMTDFVKRMNVSSISEEFVNPYKFQEQDYEVCEYALDHGRKVYAHGGLLQKCGIALPERLADLSVESWPLAPDYIQTAQDYFAGLLQEAPELDGAPSLLEMQMIVEGQLRWLCVSSATVRRQEQRVLQLRFLSVDSEKRELARLLNQSESDPLTHAMNRNGLIHAMKQMAQRQQTYAFVMLDVDGFKHFNDTYGHLAGDAVLIHMVEKLTAGLPQEDLVARIGGDEFALCLQMGEDEGIIQQKISHVHAAILSDSSQDLQLSASLGIALCPQDGSTFEELYQKADVAMYCAKRKGGNRYLCYQPDMVMPGQETMERRPRLSQQHYLLRYQPQTQVFQYPPELKEIFRTPFDGRTLWDALEADHAARPDTVKHLRETIPQLGQSGAPGAHFSEHLLRVANGMWRWFRIGIVATGGGEPMVITLTDVNDELREARQLHHLAEFDELTGLMTHGAFTREADRILAADPAGVKNGDYAMVYFDIHRFKGINDKFGMSEGDRLLIYIANGLQSLITQEEVASRVGSDRFALLLHRQGEALEALLDRYFRGWPDTI